MRSPEDVARVKWAVASQLSRADIGASHQRALLQGILAALNWVAGGNVPAVQRIADGEQVEARDDARIAGPSMKSGLILPR